MDDVLVVRVTKRYNVVSNVLTFIEKIEHDNDDTVVFCLFRRVYKIS